jgi:hypothetical protein
VSRKAVLEYAARQHERYMRATRQEKRRILDEFVAVTGYHRKAAIRLLRRSPDRFGSGGRRGRPTEYGPEIACLARTLWEASGQISSRRLQPFLPQLVDRLAACGEINASREKKALMKRASPATLDRLLAPARREYRPRGRTITHPGTLLRNQIPIRTFSDWNDAVPGFLEVDLVAHCGESGEGFFLCTLTAVDIATAWIELEAIWGKGQQRVMAGIHLVRQRLPIPLKGLDSDNGGEFINHVLYDYTQKEQITFTRSRPYKKNDSAHVEQKNGAVVRQLVGYDRYNSKVAYAQLAKVYRLIRLHANFFQPVQKLVSKTRNGARAYRRYDVARTPYQRLCDANVLGAAKRKELELQYRNLNPLKLRREIDAELGRLWELSTSTVSSEPEHALAG